MKRFLCAFTFLNVLTVFANPALANGTSNHFSGMWLGIDNGDGSLTTLSITDSNNDGIMTVRLTDSFFAKCKEAGYATTPGLVEGNATVQNKMLVWDYSFKCYDPSTNKLVEIKKDTEKFEFNAMENTLIDSQGEIFHHISTHK